MPRATRLLCAGLLLLATMAAVAEPPGGVWDFAVDLDGESIGSHRFTVVGPSDARQVTSDASFVVKVLGFVAYRYRHEASERWRGDCLLAISARTDDNGTPSEVQLNAQDLRTTLPLVDGRGSRSGVGSCLMSFAYWNPSLREQSRLLNAQTGKLEAVQIGALGESRVMVRGKSVVATGLRIVGPAQPIDVWYDPDGRWIGLDTIVAGHRRLRYRMQ